MAINEEITLPPSGLSGSRQALLEKRLSHARQTSANQAGPRPAIPHRPRRPNIPLSFAQEQLWFLDQLEPCSPVYNVCQPVRLNGSLDVPALERSLNEIIRRHESLRTNFAAVDGSPVQVIADRRTLRLAVVKLDAQPDAGNEEALHRLLDAESLKPFNLAHDLLLRVLLARIRPDEHVLMLTMHHIVSDAWSLGVFFHELASHYAAIAAGEPGSLPELPIQYADYAIWERERLEGRALEKQLAYWKNQLSGNLPVLQLPADHSRASRPLSRGAAEILQLSPMLTQKLKALALQEGATLFMTLLAAFQVLLYRYTGQEDVVVGSAVAGRRQMELEKLIGFFVNTLVLRGDLTGNPTFRELLGRGREMVLGALAHQDLSFMKLVQELRPDRSRSRNPFFQVMFVLQNATLPPVHFPGLQLQTLETGGGTAKFDLTLSVIETPQGLRAALDYNADLFERETMARLLQDFQTLLEAIVADPGRRIAGLPLLTAAEQPELPVDANNTDGNYSREKNVEALPLSPKGKIDRSSPPSFDARPGLEKKYAAPRDPVEGQLAAIWTEMLGLHRVGVHDHFFDLGGHSLLAVRLVARIEKTFGKKLSVAMIFQRPTIEQLGQLLQESPADAPPVSSLVEIRPQGSRPPLYFVHGVGGGMFWGYANLARHLSPDQPVYAFKSRGLDGLEEWPTIEEMAAHYVADLRAFQPHGPYLLGGYCFGGNVAHEMACQLHAQGEQTALIALINCLPPNTAYVNTRFIFSLRWTAKFLRNLAFWLGAFLFHWKQSERRDFIRWKFRLLGRKLARLAGLNRSDPTQGQIDQLVDLSAFVGDQRRLWEGHIRALIRYKPRAYAGRITLFRTRGHPLCGSFDEQYGWGELAEGGVAVEMVPGGHASILEEPHVRTTAAKLQRCLDDLDLSPKERTESCSKV